MGVSADVNGDAFVVVDGVAFVVVEGVAVVDVVVEGVADSTKHTLSPKMSSRADDRMSDSTPM